MQIILTILLAIVFAIILELCYDKETHEYQINTEHSAYELWLKHKQNDKPTVFIHKHDVNINISKK